MPNLFKIRARVESAFADFDFTDKCIGTTYRNGDGIMSLSVSLHDLKADMYKSYAFSKFCDNSSITVIGPDDKAVTTYHSHEEVLEAMIKNMKEWGVDYDNI